MVEESHETILDRAESSRDAVLFAYTSHMYEHGRFLAILGPEAGGSVVMGYVRRYGPMLVKYGTAAGGGAGILAALGNVFPKLTSLLGMVNVG